MRHLAISLLGPFRVTVDGEPVTQFGADTARALLAYLAVQAYAQVNAPHRREVLAGLLWPDQPEADARHNLAQALNRLRTAIGDRKAVPPYLTITRQTLQFNPESDHWLDVTTFSDLIAVCRGHPHRSLGTCPSCAGRLQEAVDLYRGDFMAGFSLPSAPFEEWVVVQREELHRQALDLLAHLATYHEGCGAYEQATHWARRQVALEPWREGAHRQAMRALALSGQRAAALAQYEACRRTLIEEMGIEPEQETVDLYERIRDRGELHPVAPTPPHNLPTPLIPFVGREVLLAEISRRLQDPTCRLLTLVGPGGSGKTRLAVEAAAKQIYEFEHGTYLVSCAPLRSAETVVPTVAQAIGFSFYQGGDAQGQLLSYLRKKRMLLILDNLENFVAELDLVTDILHAAPGVKIVATSRIRLNLRYEHLLPVGGLAVPDRTPIAPGETQAYDAIRLFLQSARRVRPRYEPTADIAHVARICRLVQGMPLAVLLAASWMGVLSPAEIGDEMGRGLDFLETDLRDMPQRHRSMRAVFDASWRLLSEAEREVFAGLSVFRGGFARQAAQAVTGAGLRTLKALVDKSFLQWHPAGRYQVHELLRQYAAEKLGQAPEAGAAVRDRHSAYYAAAIGEWGHDLKGPRQRAAIAEMAGEIENVRAAWDRAVERGQVGRLDRAMEGLGLYYEWRARGEEGEAAFKAAAGRLAQMEGGAPKACTDRLHVWAKALMWQGRIRECSGRTERSRQLLRQSLDVLDHSALAGRDTRPERAFILRQVGNMENASGRPEKAQQTLAQSLALYRALGDRWETANTLHWLGRVVKGPGAFDEARELHQEALSIRRALGDRRGISMSLSHVAVVLSFQGQFEEAERLLRESQAICREMGGDRVTLAWGHRYLAETLYWQGKFAECLSQSETCLAICSDLGESYALSFLAHLWLGNAKTSLGRYKEARAHLQSGLAWSQKRGSWWGVGVALFSLGRVALAEGEHAEAQRCLEKSVALSREGGQRSDVGPPLATLGCAALRLGQVSQARQCLCEALQVSVQIRDACTPMVALPVVALLLADGGEAERAVELYALASRYPFVANSRWFEDVVGRHITAVAAALPPDVVTAARERGRARDPDATVDALLAELSR